ncbi:hypothetical protein TRFO_13614 [Tritrichomonas foetus]|uniref:Uncharacterized protein n=1 Tax=Tritrichomonas foetus TaxID=1144522 RepID=A0A1J4L1U4_9EUKA|nr:hypothetical protein TRFO_13614 [Tritrichomonas foetus]|eukprot:OHT15940.1 hypothetical protein TRFO_13614 [Tritrichomonas foetus]
MIQFQAEDVENHDLLLYKEYINYPVNTSNYKFRNIEVKFKADRCSKLYITGKNKKDIFFNITDDGKFLYKPEVYDDSEIDIICRCHKSKDAFCETYINLDYNKYYLIESQTSDGITVTKPLTKMYPRGSIKREILNLSYSNSEFYYTKSWEGDLKTYTIKDTPNTYQISVNITVPKGRPDYRCVQLYMSGDGFDHHPIGFDEYSYMEDPLAFLKNIGLDQEMKSDWIYFGNDSELYLIIDIEPKFDETWCSSASKFSPLPVSSINSSVIIECGTGMKWSDGVCVVNNPLSWKFWLIIAGVSLVGLILIIGTFILVVKCLK